MSDSPLSANKALALKALTGLFNHRDFSLLDSIFTVEYVQHNPTIATGRDGLKAVAPHLSPELHYTPGMIVAEGDYVMIHGRYIGWARSRSSGSISSASPTDSLPNTWDVLQGRNPRIRNQKWQPNVHQSPTSLMSSHQDEP